MTKIKNVVVGLIKGRHEMPVDKYIFEEEIKDVFDFQEISKAIMKFLETTVGIKRTYGCGLNQNGYEDIEIFVGEKKLIVYVTGLTCVTAELIKLCALNGVDLTLMHYNNANGEYVPQIIF